MISTDACVMENVYTGKKYYGAINVLTADNRAQAGISFMDVVIIGTGKERFACNPSHFIQKQGYTECPSDAINCDA